MTKEIDLWRFVASRLERGEVVILLIVAESSGSSPGRAGYKMAIGGNGELIGSIGGGVMEVALVEQAKAESATEAGLVEQVHRRGSANASGMICSGRQTVIWRRLGAGDLPTVREILEGFADRRRQAFEISNLKFETVASPRSGDRSFFSTDSETGFVYQERLITECALQIIGGGHCALALSEIASSLGFRISIFDDRPGLNTLEKNVFADDVTVIESYDEIARHVPQGSDVYVVVMTLGYVSDAVVIRHLIGHDVRYLGVLGSKAKMKTLLKELADDGLDRARLARIRAPVGLAINSRTPAEIAVSIAAEIIAVKNG